MAVWSRLLPDSARWHLQPAQEYQGLTETKPECPQAVILAMRQAAGPCQGKVSTAAQECAASPMDQAATLTKHLGHPVSAPAESSHLLDIAWALGVAPAAHAEEPAGSIQPPCRHSQLSKELG